MRLRDHKLLWVDLQWLVAESLALHVCQLVNISHVIPCRLSVAILVVRERLFFGHSRLCLSDLVFMLLL